MQTFLVLSLRRRSSKLQLLPLNPFPINTVHCLENMAPGRKKDDNKGKDIATGSIPDPVIRDQENRPVPTANLNQANPTAPATEQPITRADLDRVVAEVTNRFASQQEALVDQLMSRLRDVEEIDRNTESWGESRSGGSRRRQRSFFFEEANNRNSHGRSRAWTQPLSPNSDPRKHLEPNPTGEVPGKGRM